jgi:hexulose-6-phosphate isomerase
MTARAFIAIMQGRLSAPINGQIQAFPAAEWRDEFGRAATAKLDGIEWIFDAPDNPIISDGGIAEIAAQMGESGVSVRSVCADYFMDAPLHRGAPSDVTHRVDILQALVTRARTLGVRHIVLPCVDQSALRDRSDEDRLTEVLAAVVPNAGRAGVELHLETSLGPIEFAALLDRVPAEVRANYDSGNSASLGYRVTDEFAAYGARVGSVHIKDRVRGGGTVPLGTGNADLPALFDALDRVSYKGMFTLQVARAQTGDEVAWARRNREQLLQYLTGVSRS